MVDWLLLVIISPDLDMAFGSSSSYFSDPGGWHRYMQIMMLQKNATKLLPPSGRLWGFSCGSKHLITTRERNEEHWINDRFQYIHLHTKCLQPNNYLYSARDYPVVQRKDTIGALVVIVNLIVAQC
jgi:hypothetical protein